MKGLAHISFPGGGLIVAAQTPYERELLFEHVELSTKRYGRVRLDLSRQHWTISLKNGESAACASCSQCVDNLAYRFEERTLCGQCARRALR
jgi:hypothetical protein